MRMKFASARLLLATGLGCAATGCQNDPAPPAPIVSPGGPGLGDGYGSGNGDCVLEEPSAAAGLVPEGLLEGADYYACDWPSGPSKGAARFSAFDFDDAVLTAVPVSFTASWEGTDSLEGRTILLSAGKGFFAFPATSDDYPLSGTVHLHEDASTGPRNVRLAVLAEDSDLTQPVIGATASVVSNVIRVSSGDLQVALHWSKKVDLDLFVTEPGGAFISSGTVPAPSGGKIDLDSYSLCRFAGDRGHGNEHIVWPDGPAPRGGYEVSVRLYSACAVTEPIEYRVTVVQDRNVDVFKGTLDPAVDVAQRKTVATFRH